jgi:hypothetical protein
MIQLSALVGLAALLLPVRLMGHLARRSAMDQPVLNKCICLLNLTVSIIVGHCWCVDIDGVKREGTETAAVNLASLDCSGIKVVCHQH